MQLQTFCKGIRVVITLTFDFRTANALLFISHTDNIQISVDLKVPNLIFIHVKVFIIWIMVLVSLYCEWCEFSRRGSAVNHRTIRALTKEKSSNAK